MDIYEPEAFTQRVNFAARVISSGGTPTRNFDTCFEMWDGSAVAVALYRRALKNQRLREKLFSYIARNITVQEAFANRRRTDLSAWAAELRAKAKES